MNRPPTPDIHSLVARHAAGDRSPELLWALNQAAFECFHAPWEVDPPSPELLIPPHLVQGRLPVDGEREDDLTIPASTSERLQDLLSRVLRGLRLPLYRRGARTFLLDLGHDIESDSLIQLYLSFDPDRRRIRFRATSDLTCPYTQREDLARWCELWNRRLDLPDATLVSPGPGARCRVEATWPLEIPQEADADKLHDLLQAALGQAAAFFRCLRDQQSGPMA